jgi:hypothetical protein
MEDEYNYSSKYIDYDKFIDLEDTNNKINIGDLSEEN